MPDRLAGKICLVTGGASGIGAATARRFKDEGATVIVSDVQDELGQALAKDIGATYLRQDVSREDEWKGAFASIKSDHGRLDVLVNNAGIFRGATIEETSLEIWRQVLDVNLTGVMLGCREAIAIMKDNPEGPAGSLINISSITGFVGLASGAAYTASKGGVRLLSKSIAVHCARTYQNIRCNSVHPGTIDTPMNQAAFDASEDPAAMRDMFSSLQPIGRMIRSDEVAGAALYLASDEASAVTGTELLIDGGWLAAPNPL
ncbi:MAG: SDR family oxidoreductase [Pseudomonadota bacterium]